MTVPIKTFLIDRIACGIPLEAICAEGKSIFGIDITKDQIDEILTGSENLILERQLEIEKKISDTSPYTIIIENIEKLRNMSEDYETKPAQFVKLLSTLKEYLNFFVASKKHIETRTSSSKEVYVDNARDFYDSVKILENEGLLVVKEDNKLKELCKVKSIDNSGS